MGAPGTDKAGVKKTIKALREAGLTVKVWDDDTSEETEYSTIKETVAEVMVADDGSLVTYTEDGTRGWVWFVYGNDPREVICDHSTNLSYVLDPLTHKWWNP